MALGCTNPNMNMALRTYYEFSKNSEILGYKTWVPVVHTCKVSWGLGARGNVSKKNKFVCIAKNWLYCMLDRNSCATDTTGTHFP